MATNMKSTFSILRQSDFSQIESNTARQYALMYDIPLLSASLATIDAHVNQLQQNIVLPIGSVEFIRKVMQIAHVAEPENISYPSALVKHLHRRVDQCLASEIVVGDFVKSVNTKTFTGFVYGQTDEDAREQQKVFDQLPSTQLVWRSSAVEWLCEYRYYVLQDVIIGVGRYDSQDNELVPDIGCVHTMIEQFASTSPVAYSLDVGVLADGTTALVECNDAWALGMYRGTLTYTGYINMLLARWKQMIGIFCN
jgi:hypothetical protein